eukprot:TRINITY_DN2418_c0_g1_i1.p1 TRINITY_DN2418_c0_g1~~TRINITY_DN2418_c0_g1_i1.p1  ORF type:complete len:368 (+),score=138.17 TRINITY_DN2418_c0_g1_i1:196-1299(+)
MSSPTKKSGFPKHDRTHTGHKSPRGDEPKKGGAGGKGTWGVAGSEVNAEISTRDPLDPNYDSEKDDDVYVPPLPGPLETFKQDISVIIREYFVSGDAEEAINAFRELKRPNFHHEIVKAVISKSLDQHDRERELASNLLPKLFPDMVTNQQVEQGFSVLLQRLEDLSLDIPSAPEYLAMFLARATVDDLLPPSFLSADNSDVELAQETLLKAKNMLQGKGAAKRIENIWGTGKESVKRIKERASDVLSEYVVSNDIKEVDRAIRELNMATFHWWLVKKGILLALDCKESDREKIDKLFTALSKSGLISEQHFEVGVKACLSMMKDIELDAPNGRAVLGTVISRGVSSGYFPATAQDDFKEATSVQTN